MQGNEIAMNGAVRLPQHHQRQRNGPQDRAPNPHHPRQPQQHRRCDPHDQASNPQHHTLVHHARAPLDQTNVPCAPLDRSPCTSLPHLQSKVHPCPQPAQRPLLHATCRPDHSWLLPADQASVPTNSTTRPPNPLSRSLQYRPYEALVHSPLCRRRTTCR